MPQWRVVRTRQAVTRQALETTVSGNKNFLLSFSQVSSNYTNYRVRQLHSGHGPFRTAGSTGQSPGLPNRVHGELSHFSWKLPQVWPRQQYRLSVPCQMCVGRSKRKRSLHSLGYSVQLTTTTGTQEFQTSVWGKAGLLPGQHPDSHRAKSPALKHRMPTNGRVHDHQR